MKEPEMVLAGSIFILTLALGTGGHPHTIIYYLDTPPTRDELLKLIADIGISVRGTTA